MLQTDYWTSCRHDVRIYRFIGETNVRKNCLLVALCLILAAGGIFIYTFLRSPSLSASSDRGDGNVNIAPASLHPSPAVSATPDKKNTGDTCDNLLVLVDRTHSLPGHYVPSDLVHLNEYGIPVNNNTILGRHIMVDALKQMIAAGQRAGFYLVAASAYRSYADQVSIFNAYVRDYGLEKANTFSAKPGQSQHQLGTAIDFTTAQMGYGLSQTFAYTGTGHWLLANAYKYGFYISYPQGKESVTGYECEPWHFRYLGVQNARDLQRSGLIMQTYLERMAITPHC